MNPVEEIYKESFFSKRKSLIWRAPILCKIIKDVFKLIDGDKIVDVGCAIGEFVKEFPNIGLYAKGIEGSSAVIKYLIPGIEVSIFDIRKPFPNNYLCIGKIYDLCMCLEVAEHIDREYVDIFIDNLCYLSKKIIISAASPGQQGHGHCNCQPKEYWEIKFGIRNYKRNIEKEKYFKKLLEPYKRKKGLNAYYQNTMIFEDKNPRYLEITK